MKCQYLPAIPSDAVAIPGYAKSFATPRGEIVTAHGRPKLRRFGVNSCGYPICGLKRDDGAHHFVMVHRVIAKLFVPGNQTLTVNHKDLNKANCAAENLEWITFSANHIHANAHQPERARSNGIKLSRAVVATNPATGERREFASGKLAAMWVGNSTAGGNISKAIATGREAYGFAWSKA